MGSHKVEGWAAGSARRPCCAVRCGAVLPRTATTQAKRGLNINFAAMRNDAGSAVCDDRCGVARRGPVSCISFPDATFPHVLPLPIPVLVFPKRPAGDVKKRNKLLPRGIRSPLGPLPSPPVWPASRFVSGGMVTRATCHGDVCYSVSAAFKY